MAKFQSIAHLYQLEITACISHLCVEYGVKKIHAAIIFLSSLGILLAIYLLWQQIYHPAFQPCSINETINCDAIISGPVSRTFGVRTPIFGLIGYIVLFYAALFHKKKAILVTAIGGLAFCLWIAYQELIILRVICPVCIVCQLDMLTVFTLSIVLNRSKQVVSSGKDES